MNFTITNIAAQRSPNGETTYYGVSDDSVNVECTLPNARKVTKRILHDKFTSAYMKNKSETGMIKIGDKV